jgi:formylglycine-generating enzyme required for sulfatase activity
METLQEITPHTGSAWRTIPAGSFLMGENPEDKFTNDTERPRHSVNIAQPFAMAAFPVTVGEYRRWQPGFAPLDNAGWPVVGVSWEDAQEYCHWLNNRQERVVRLPSEAEWEYACRAGSDEIFSCGDTLSERQANYLYSENGARVGVASRTPSGSYPPNAFGIYDMHGLVCEWTEDLWHESYQEAPDDGLPWVTGGRTNYRVVRGGAWDYLPRLLRSSWRDGVLQTTQRDNLGFRLVSDL